ncbi:Ig-like domain-containing protein [Adhaeribacter radiodurans]|uniref:Ig-like domain-containing protein n=1 Tax=Adhaeribacter radiodurans TaxID=2745197 RepID=A0A7L7LE44_9BACT|nr:Ig-like domain-containing protein [Adhaeribacter radiodurans]QMU31080.1 Ig-like domain-containing protein [Adhaeribacter radiodurans]
MHTLKKILPSFFLLFLTSCASISPPEGGEKDIKSPELISSTPANQALNVKGKTIILKFNEEVRTKDFNRQLIISPNAENTINTQVDREEVKLSFEKDFEQNTTYFLNFREGIEDITEGNKPKNLSLTFSTGAFLDSGRVQGIVTDILTGEPAKDINVILYAANDTATIRNAKPYYLTKTGEDGSYLLQNIKYATYLLYAHQDKNNDNIYNDEKEKIGYLANPIEITAQTPAQDLQIIRIDTKAPYITSKQPYLDEYHLNYNEGITSVKITGGNPNDVATLISENTKTVRLFPSTNQIKGKYFITALDSADNAKIDTVDLAFTGKKAKRNLSFQVINPSTKVKPNETIQFKFDAPLQLKEGPLLTLVEDSAAAKRPLNYPQDIKLNDSRNIISFNLNTKAKNTVEILADTTVILPISGDRFKNQATKLTITDKDQGGSIDLKIKTSYKKYFLELLDKDYKVVKTYDSPKNLLIEELQPNTYRIRVKIDEDENGEWRGGNKDLKTIPEKVFNYLKPIEVRVNWSQDVPIEF